MTRVIICFLAITLYALTASAQNDSLRRAYELRLAGHDEAALPLLEQAYAATPTPSVAAQLGLCELAVGQWDNASKNLHDALASPNDPWVARHLQALESAYTLVLAHFPRQSSASPMTSSGNASEHGNSSESRNSALTEVSINENTRHAENPLQRSGAVVTGNSWQLPVGYSAAIVGGVFIVGGIVSLILREHIVDDFNNRGCHVGDPMPAAGCDAAGAIAGRNTTTALGAAGLTAGSVIGIAGVTLLLLHGREESFPQHGFPQRRLAISTGPGDIGISATWIF